MSLGRGLHADQAGRTLKRYAGQELRDRARRQSHGPAARRDRSKRPWFQGRSFGEAAVEHGFKRARWRGLWRQQIQDLLIAAIQNLKIYLRHLFVRHFFTWLRPATLRAVCSALRGLLAVDSFFPPLHPAERPAFI